MALISEITWPCEALAGFGAAATWVCERRTACTRFVLLATCTRLREEADATLPELLRCWTEAAFTGALRWWTEVWAGVRTDLGFEEKLVDVVVP